MEDFANLCNVHTYISVSLLASREIQALAVKLFSINNPKEQTANSNTHRVYRVLEVSAFPPALGHTQSQGKGSSSPGEHSTLAQRSPAPANTHSSEWAPAPFPLGRSHTAAALQHLLLSHLSSQPTNNLWKSPWKLPALLPHGHFLRRAITQLLLGRFLWRSSALTSLTPSGKLPAPDEVSYSFVQSTLRGLRSFSRILLEWRLHNLSSSHCYTDFSTRFSWSEFLLSSFKMLDSSHHQ